MSTINAKTKTSKKKLTHSLCITTLSAAAAMFASMSVAMASDWPIADAHIHYSHDSVELTPPERVIEIMREANLKFALVSSSDDNGTQLLSALAPELIVPGLRPYRRRGELGTWFTDPEALAYVEKLLANNKYASIGEFHLSGSDADLPIPQRIVELADQHNLILHAHSDADAVERLLAQNENVKVIWAHSGFEGPEGIADMLGKHDRLWADLAFRSEVGSGGQLSEEWIELFTTYPDRMMLGTDTYTPERMYFIPEHAGNARTWLASLPPNVAENVAWKNAYNLIMPIWKSNSEQGPKSKSSDCPRPVTDHDVEIKQDGLSIVLQPKSKIEVSQPVSLLMTLCGENVENTTLKLDASMPAHGHGTNYTPEHSIKTQTENTLQYEVDGVVLHMPGQWQWQIEARSDDGRKLITHDFLVE